MSASISDLEFNTEKLRREVIQLAGNIAICQISFVTNSFIESVDFETVPLTALSTSSSSSTPIDHSQTYSKKVKSIIWCKTNSQNSYPYTPGTQFSPGDYSLGICMDSEIEAKELVSVIITVRYQSISNFLISQMLCQSVKILNQSPGHVFQLVNKAEGENMSHDRKIRNDIAKLHKMIENITAIATPSVPVPTSSVSSFSSTSTAQVPTPTPSQVTQATQATQEVQVTTKTDPLSEMRDKLIEMLVIIKDIREQMNETYIKDMCVKISTKMSELTTNTNNILSKTETLTDKTPIVRIADLTNLTFERNVLLKKLEKAEDFIESLQEKLAS